MAHVGHRSRSLARLMTSLRQTPLFSIVIPLEFHRGQIERCLTGWTRGQTCPDDEYELVVVAPEHLDAKLISKVQRLLRDQDTLLLDPSDHDMTLCVAGARAARGRVLFFTESHCWPEPDALALAKQTLHQHPEWAGFSARSIRVTHNRLSEIEADMYEADIEYGMLHHPWRKILDQCFVVHRDAYERSGGFEAELGHFAEWLLAVRFFRQGMKVGYAPEVRLHHYYIGDLREIEKFTDDFITGQARYLARPSVDPLLRDLPELPFLSHAGNWRRSAGPPMMRLVLKARTPPLQRYRQWFSWLIVANVGLGRARYLAWVQASKVRSRLLWTLYFADRAERQEELRNYCGALIRLISARLCKEYADKPAVADRGDVNLGDPLSLPASGFHLREELDGRLYRWSAPEAMLELPVPDGRYRIVLTWTPIRSIVDVDVTFYWNEDRAQVAKIVFDQHSVTIHVDNQDKERGRLGWTCRPHSIPNDLRRLGLPLERIEWGREGSAQE